MTRIIPVDPSEYSFDIFKDLTIKPRMPKPGPPLRIEGMTVGIITMEHDAPHGGEMHPDGDELLYVIQGQLSVTCDSAPNDPVLLGPGDACIVKQGEWHKVNVMEKTQLVHTTPGPGGDHRPLPDVPVNKS